MFALFPVHLRGSIVRPPPPPPGPGRLAQLFSADAGGSCFFPRNAGPPLCLEVLGSQFLPLEVREILFGLGHKVQRVKGSPAQAEIMRQARRLGVGGTGNMA